MFVSFTICQNWDGAGTCNLSLWNAHSITWLLMTWQRNEPGYQQSWYWPQVCFRAILIPSWWRHPMGIFFALLALCAGNSPVTGEFPSQRPVAQSFDVCTLTNGWVSNCEAGDLRRHRAHYDVIVMMTRRCESWVHFLINMTCGIFMCNFQSYNVTMCLLLLPNF